MLRKEKLGFFCFGFSDEISRVCLALICRFFPHATGNSIIKEKTLKLSQNTVIPEADILRRINKTEIKVARTLVTLQETATMPTRGNHSKTAV